MNKTIETILENTKHHAKKAYHSAGKTIGANLPSYTACYVVSAGDPELALKIHVTSVLARWAFHGYVSDKTALLDEDEKLTNLYVASIGLTMPERVGYWMGNMLTK